jgi:hypothetical protein
VQACGHTQSAERLFKLLTVRGLGGGSAGFVADVRVRRNLDVIFRASGDISCSIPFWAIEYLTDLAKWKAGEVGEMQLDKSPV